MKNQKKVKLLSGFLTGLFILACSAFVSLDLPIPATEVYKNDNDGPYVFFRKNKAYVKRVLNKDSTFFIKIDSLDQKERENFELECTFKNRPELNFKTKLKPKLKVEPSEYNKVGKMLVVSDIEGNYETLHRFLVANGVIDEQHNWTFGAGHLVCLGDFFDRGQNVTECLWLIYDLEEKAKAAGGYVHFILGNHEIMNMSNDFRYVHGKYVKNAEMMQEPIVNWYKSNTELGRWLATKNIIERVGDMLFVHGGIASEVNKMDLDIAEINAKCRPFYFISADVFRLDDLELQFLFDDNGPFWFRKYVTMGVPEIIIDATLKKFNVKHIAVGHTIVDKVKFLYGNKIVAVDTRHTSPISTALYIDEEKRFYRVTQTGKKEEL
jgi:Calcineurin-like phosphoesterase